MRTPAALLLAMLVLIALLPLALITTQPGTQWLLNVAQRLTPLQLKYQAGTLHRGLQLSRVAVELDTAYLQMDNVELAVEARCLTALRLCLSQLDVGEIALILPPTSDDSAPEPAATSAAPFKLPITVSAPVVRLNRLLIEWQGGQWHQGPMKLGAHLSGSDVHIAPAVIQQPVLQVDASADSDKPLSLPQVSLPLNLVVEKLALEQPALVLSQARHPLQSLTLAGSWSGTRLRLDQLFLAADDYGELALSDTRLELNGNWPLQAAADIRIAPGATWEYLRDRHAQLDISGNAEDLRVAFSATGSPGVNGNGRFDLLAETPTFNTDLVMNDLESLALTMPADLPQRFHISQVHSPLAISVQGSTAQQAFSLTGAAQTPAYGLTRITLAGAHADGELRIDNLLLQDNAGSSLLTSSGRISLSPTLTWSLQLASDGLPLSPLLPQLNGSLAGRLHTTGKLPQAEDETLEIAISETALTGTVNGAAAQISGRAGLAGGGLTADSALNATLNGAALTLQTQGDTGIGQLDIRVDDLQQWLADAHGTLNATLEFSNAAEDVRLSGTFAQLRWQQYAAASGNFQGSYTPAPTSPPQSAPSFELNLAATELRAGEFALDSLEVASSGTGDRQKVRLQSMGDLNGVIAISGAGNRDAWSGQLASTSLQLLGADLQLTEDVALDWSAAVAQLHVARHCWRYSDASICMKDMRLGRDGQGGADIKGDVAAFSPWLPQRTQIQGALTASGAFRWSADKPLTASAQLAVTPLAITQTTRAGEPITAKLSQARATVEAKDQVFNLAAQLGGETQGTLALELAVDRARALAANDPGQTTVQGRLRADNFNLTPLSPLLRAVDELEGQLDGQWDIAGTLAAPRLQGALALTEGRLALPDTPTTLEQLNLQLLAAGDRGTLAGEALFGGSPLHLEGQLTTQPEFTVDLQLRGEKHNVVYPPSAEARISEELSFSISKDQLSISGDVTVHSGAFLFEQLSRDGVDLSDNVVRVDLDQDSLEQRLPFDVTMDLRVIVKDDFKVAGELLETNLYGDLSLRRRPRRPLQLFGALETSGGYVHAFDRILVIKRGTISFNGNPNNPLINMRAERRIIASDVTAGLHLHGALADNLALDIYSDPVMTQGEAMSYLIWGRRMGSGTTGDGTVVALSLAGSAFNRTSLVSTLNQVPGVSDISFGAEGSDEDAAATVSGYIGERIYLSYGIGLYEPINVVTVRLFLQSRLWLEVVSRLENSVDLYYAFDIE